MGGAGGGAEEGTRRRWEEEWEGGRCGGEAAGCSGCEGLRDLAFGSGRPLL